MKNAKVIGKQANRALPALILVLVLICGLFSPVYAASKVNPRPDGQNNFLYYFPVISGPDTPAGSYHCLEYEFGLIWNSETITLNLNGTSIYAYDPSPVVTGTWAYAPTTREVSFTNFGWSPVRYEAPDGLYASRDIPGAGFSVAISCGRLS